MQDRTNLTPELLQRMRQELIDLLSKYVEMDKDALELNFDQEGGQMALMLSIPVLRAKDEAEIEAEEEKTEADEEESDEEIESEADIPKAEETEEDSENETDDPEEEASEPSDADETEQTKEIEK